MAESAWAFMKEWRFAGYEAKPSDISKTRDIGLAYPLICAGEIFLPAAHNEDTRAGRCSVCPFPREDASWPEHYLSSAFFHASANQRFKQPLSELRPLLSKYVPCLHFLENQDYYFKVLQGINFFKNYFLTTYCDNSLSMFAILMWEHDDLEEKLCICTRVVYFY
jgi:hypothetical protein